MSAPVPYFDVIRKMPNAFDYRLRLVTQARQHGVKATARAFSTTARTVRKWLRRYRDQGLKACKNILAPPAINPIRPRPTSSSRPSSFAANCPPSAHAA